MVSMAIFPTAATAALLRVRGELARSHVLDHALTQRTDSGSVAHGSSILSEVDKTSISGRGSQTRQRCPLSWLPVSRFLPPRSGLERSDFVHWHFSDVTAGLRNVCCWGKSGSRDCVTRLPSLLRVSDAGRSQRCGLHRWRGAES